MLPVRVTLRWIGEHQALPARLACGGLGYLWVILSSLGPAHVRFGHGACTGGA